MRKIIISLLFLASVISLGEDSQKIKVQKDKSGANVYNFNFYHQNNDEKKLEKKEEPKKEVVEEKKIIQVQKDIPIPKVKEEIVGNGLELGLTTLLLLDTAEGTAELDPGLGFRLGFINRLGTSGYYITPGVQYYDAKAKYEGFGIYYTDRYYEGSALGGYLKIGKYERKSSSFLMDMGLEISYLESDMDSKHTHSGEYDLKMLNLSAYGGPVFKLGHFMMSTVIHLGFSDMSVEESFISYGYFPGSKNISESEINPFMRLSVNVNF